MYFDDVIRDRRSVRHFTDRRVEREKIEAVLRHCHSLMRAVLPSTLKRMTEGGFYDCPSLRELVIPEDIDGLEIQSFDTSPHLLRTVAGGFVYDHGRAEEISS